MVPPSPSSHQIISLRVRSSIPKDWPEEQVPRHPCDVVCGQRELDYCGLLNRSLPAAIRVLGWTEVTPGFNARFSATCRTYRYFFVRRRLDIAAMRRAAALLEGSHDFRNLCRMDLDHVTHFRREVFSAVIEPFVPEAAEGERALWMLEIRGVAFLWHMVRCIMAVLFLVGGQEGQAEDPEVLQRLLDPEQVAGKPSYRMAPSGPLVLHRCGFDRLPLGLQPATLWALTRHWEGLWEQHRIAAARAENALQFLGSCRVRSADVAALLRDMEAGPGPTKRKRPAPEEPPPALAPGSEEDVSWGEVLGRIALQAPRPGPEESLLQRRREPSYDQKMQGRRGHRGAEGSGGLEKEGPDEDGEAPGGGHSSSETAAFFERMRQQGSLLR
mmetsp:Transcript_22541/g.32388  ORF Transcript_22541/g.32388 Transcript_22541/m.32388 type:complete len:385 (-) Transcript_22541:789-1943(-)|eukprot:CAMPEP_0170064300 /NCGR_PEP_ID=MMETSP0019_2-20121128/4838_1 /TAXON_ID=98059 /ORGANISM="Dinobryon sp., Strain UTEXLB2267" /LENGTH=384 /DNA_ID=CAMNT_0010270933 /DNA_START=966 /DNA_END=2120 /DNA_ORIENTATION=-